MRNEAAIFGNARDTRVTVRGAPRVLLAEDDNAFRHLLANTLRCGGFDVVELRNGRELIDQIACRLLDPADGMPIDLIISDNRMPRMTGLDVLGTLRRADWITPVILITAFGDEATRSEATRLGVSAMFDKPFDLSDLRTMALHLTGH